MPTVRDHLEAAAKRGSKAAIAQLESPPFPVGLEYLHNWLLELHGRSGVGMSGLVPLTYTTIADWKELKGIDIAPHEVEALLMLDAVMTYPGEPEEE